MDPPRFVDHYRDLIAILRKFGIPVPWLEAPQSILSRVLYFTIDILVILLPLYPLFIYAYTLANTSLSFQDLCANGIAGGCNVCGLLVKMYHVLNRSRFHKLTKTMDTISKNIMVSNLDKKDEFLKEYRRNSKQMVTLAKYSILSSFITSFGYFWSLPVIEWYNGNYRSNHPLTITNFFNDRLPWVYESILLIISTSIFISAATKAVNDCLLVSLLKIQTTFFKYLCETQNIIQEQLQHDMQGQDHFLEWIKLHQDVIKSNEQLVQTFSPIIVIYYLIVIEIVVCGAFVESKRDSDNLMQSISIGTFVIITILYYFMLSNSSHELTTEAEKLAFVVYNLPWYRMKQSYIKKLRLVMTMCNKPRQLTAYKAPVFLLNREMFVGFMAAAASAFVTFCQVGSLSETSIAI